MRALVSDRHSVRLIEDYPDPQPAPGEVRLRTILAGICNTDLEVTRGYAEFEGVLGHEFVGVVDGLGDPDRPEEQALLGRRVVGEINVGCGRCGACHAGRPTHCAGRTVPGIRGRDGSLAEYFCLPAANLHPVPEAIPDEQAVFVEPLAAACRVVEQVHLRSADRIVVLGDGKLGLLVAQVLALTGCDLLAVGRHPEKLAILAARGIPTRVGDEDLAGSADVVVECTGQPGGFRAACRLLRPEGTLVLKSTYHGLVEADLSQLAVDEIQVLGSRCGPFAAALRLLARGLVDVEPLLEAEYPLVRALEALDHAARRGALKVLVRP